MRKPIRVGREGRASGKFARQQDAMWDAILQNVPPDRHPHAFNNLVRAVKHGQESTAQQRQLVLELLSEVRGRLRAVLYFYFGLWDGISIRLNVTAVFFDVNSTQMRELRYKALYRLSQALWWREQLTQWDQEEDL